MTAIGSLCLAIAALVADPDPEALVGRLGSSDFDERVAATEALDRLGALALPALVAAKDKADLRIRSRAVALRESIERRLGVARLTTATPVRLDFRDRPLFEVVEALNDRHGFGLALQVESEPGRGMGAFPPIDPARTARVRSRRITLEAPEPVPFWDAIDRLCRAGALQHEVQPWDAYGPRLTRFRLLADRGGTSFTSDSGPMRVKVVGVHATSSADFTTEAPRNSLRVAMRVLPEPGLHVVPIGPMTLDEAVDDRGRSLLPPPRPGAEEQAPGIVLGGDGPSALLALTADLELARDPGHAIARLRGTIPAVVVARRLDSLVIPLRGAQGQSFRAESATVVVHEVVEDAKGVTAIEVGITPRHPTRFATDPRRPDFVTYRGDRALEHLDLYDARGRELGWGWTNGLGSQSGPDTQRIRLLVEPLRGAVTAGPDGMPRSESSRPDVKELRYHDFVQATTVIRFDLRSIPMP